MKYLTEKDDIAKLDKGCKNKFRWEWLNKDFRNEKIQVWCRKIDVSGVCFCVSCNSAIKYSSEGFKSLLNHSGTSVHKKSRDSVKNSQILQSLFAGTDDVMHSDESRIVDAATRNARTEALVVSFLVEHSLSFSVAPHIIELAKCLSRDCSALNSLELSRTTASYKLKYGLAKTIKEEQIKELKNSFFSLNIDGSTSTASDNILAILVQYYSFKQKKVILRHLSSIKLSVSDSEAIYGAIAAVFEENGLPWEHLMSVLMDSCNTMRGNKNGVEKKIRALKAPHLLDIDGETCHIGNNCAKKFTQPFLKHIEILCGKIYFDLKSADKRELFFQICVIAKIKPLKLLCRPEHRWIYVLSVLERLMFLWDALLLFYYSWIGADASVYEEQLTEIYEKRKLSDDDIKCIKKIHNILQKKILTEDGNKRKTRIVQRLFVHRKKTLLYIGVYQSVLPHFNKYVKLFQSKECQLHELHVQMFNLTKQYFAFFIKHELISSINDFHDILKIDATNSENYLPDRLIFTGISCKNQSASSHEGRELIKVLKEAYAGCAEYIKKKMPLKNSFLIKLSALNPALRGETTTFSALLKLAEFLPTVISKEEANLLDLELRHYQIDGSLLPMQDKSVIQFWSKVMEQKEGSELKYPVLSKMIKAVFTCFHGPSVESTFNLMKDIISENRTSLNIESLDSIQTVKYYLSSLNASSCEVFGSKNPAHEPLERDFALNLLKSWNNYQNSLSENIAPTSSVSQRKEDCIYMPAKSNITSEIKISSQEETNSEEKNIKRKLCYDNKSKTKQTKIGSFFKK